MQFLFLFDIKSNPRDFEIFDHSYEETKPDQNYDHFTIFQFLQCFDFHKFCKFLTSVTLKIHTLMAGGGTPSERWLLVQGGGVQIP